MIDVPEELVEQIKREAQREILQLLIDTCYSYPSTAIPTAEQWIKDL